MSYFKYKRRVINEANQLFAMTIVAVLLALATGFVAGYAYGLSKIINN